MKSKPGAYFLMAIAIVMMIVLFHSAGFRYTKAKALPMVVAGIVLVLAMIEFGRDLRKKQPSTAVETRGKGEGESEGPPLRYFLEAGWLACFCFAVFLLGFVIAIPLFVFSYLITHGRKWSNAMIVSVLTIFILYGTFAYLLEVKLYSGVILDSLGW